MHRDTIYALSGPVGFRIDSGMGVVGRTGTTCAIRPAKKNCTTRDTIPVSWVAWLSESRSPQIAEVLGTLRWQMDVLLEGNWDSAKPSSRDRLFRFLEWERRN